MTSQSFISGEDTDIAARNEGAGRSTLAERMGRWRRPSPPPGLGLGLGIADSDPFGVEKEEKRRRMSFPMERPGRASDDGAAFVAAAKGFGLR